MTIKIQAYQAKGIKTDKVVDKFEFCCWDSLKKWLDSYSGLHSCPKCKSNQRADEFLNELANLFKKYSNNISLNTLINSTELYTDTVRKELKEK